MKHLLTWSEGFDRKTVTDWQQRQHNLQADKIELAYELVTEILNHASECPEHIWRMAQAFRNINEKSIFGDWRK